jgi:hypothetical protein
MQDLEVVQLQLQLHQQFLLLLRPRLFHSCCSGSVLARL